MEQELIEKFWSRVNKNGPIPEHRPELGPCWVWTASFVVGYGGFKGRKFAKTKLAHRISWELSNGEIPNGLCVLHKCDNRPCCNPSHLFLGTKMDNTRDMIHKGRDKLITNQKVTPENVQKIRQLRRDGASCIEIAGMFGITPKTASAISSGRYLKDKTNIFRKRDHATLRR